MNLRKIVIGAGLTVSAFGLASCGIPTALVGGFGYHVRGQDVFYTTGGGSESPVRTDKIWGADGRAFHILNRSFGKDNYHVYIGSATIAGADAPSFQVIGERYAKDRYRVYFLGFPITDADAQSFIVSNDDHARDRNRCYSGLETISCTKK